MESIRNLTEASAEELRDFFDSFDVVLLDCDGVIWYMGTPIPGAIAAVRRLEELGKKLYLVTNNSGFSAERYCEMLKLHGLHVQPKQVVNTAKVISWYLKKIDFDGEAFVIAPGPFRQSLANDGIKLAPEDLDVVDGNTAATVKALHGGTAVKAVIVDFSLHFDWSKIAFSITCLQRSDVLYICGAKDEWITCDRTNKFLGSGPMINLITKYSGRSPLQCAKPSETLKEYILSVCDITEPRKCLFIGDTMGNDMKFGTMCGFQKLFVDTGIDKITDVENNDDQTRPDFYIPSLSLLPSIIDSLNVSARNEDGC